MPTLRWIYCAQAAPCGEDEPIRRLDLILSHLPELAAALQINRT